VYYVLGQTDIGPTYRNSGRMWVMSIMTFPLDVFSGASCYLVSLVILLRCLALFKPLGFETWHSKFTRISIPIIWIFLVVIVLMPTAISTKMFTTNIMPDTYKDLYGTSWNIVYNTTITFPVGLITILYLAQICILKPKNNEGENNAKEVKRKAFERMIHMVTIGTLFCYAPFIMWRHVFMAFITNSCSEEAFDSTGKVLLTLKMVYR
jgi:membrane-anchored glycerophosphoryl diester phosphodiesterase (GDPDase)